MHTAHHEEQGNPLALILPFIIIIGSLTVIVISYHGELTEETFFPISITLALFVYLLTFLDPRIGIAALILSVGLSPELSIGGVQNIRLEDFVIPAIFAAWITRLIEKKEEFEPTSLKFPILTYIFFATISALIGISNETIEPRSCFFIFGKTLEYFIIFLIILNNVKTDRDAKAFIMLLIIVSLATSFLSIALYKPQQFEGGPVSRVMGPYGETANILGCYIIMQLAVIIGIFLSTQHAGYRFLLVIVAIPSGFVFLLTYSRTSYAALFLAITLLALLKEKKLLLLTVAIIVLFPFMPDTVTNRAKSMFKIGTQTPPESWDARVRSWESSIDVIVASPLFGKGVGYTKLGDVDNEYVKVVRDMGICGLGAFLWMLFMIGRDSLLFYNNIAYDPMLKGYCSGFLLAFIAICIHAMGATSFTTIRTMELFMIMTGLFYVIKNKSPEWEKLANPEAVSTSDDGEVRQKAQLVEPRL